MFNWFNRTRLGQTLRVNMRRWILDGTDLNGYSPWDQEAMSERRFDHTDSRLRRYRIYDGYYRNRIYYNIAALAALQVGRPKLYKYIRGIYNPVRRLVTLYNGKVYGGRLDVEQAADGAIPIDDADDRLRQAIIALWDASAMQRYKTLYTRNGCLYGTTAWKVVDDPQWEQVRLEALNPYKIAEVEIDDRQEISRLVIEYTKEDPATGRPYVYTEIITPEQYSTYYDGKPYAFYTDAGGTALERWDNEYGFVPVALASHRIKEGPFGDNDFTDYLDKFNEINDQQSLLNDQTRKVVNPLWAMAGGGQRVSVDAGAGRDSMDFINMPPGGSANALVFPLDIAGVISNIKSLQDEMERDLPELTLQRLREGGNLTAPGVTAGYSDAIDRIIEAQGNYDAATVKAQMMGIAIGGYRGYEEYRGYSLDSYWNGDLKHSIKERPVIVDRMAKSDKVNALNTGGFYSLALEEMGYDEEQIAAALNEKNNATSAAMQGLANSAFGAAEDEDPDEQEVEDEAAETETAAENPFA